MRTTDPQDPADPGARHRLRQRSGLPGADQPAGRLHQVDLLRNYNGDNMMGDFVDDAIYGASTAMPTTANDVDMFFNNAGGIRTDWCDKEDPANPGTYIWSSTATDCSARASGRTIPCC